jgi:hypothetical protein
MTSAALPAPAPDPGARQPALQLPPRTSSRRPSSLPGRRAGHRDITCRTVSSPARQRSPRPRHTPPRQQTPCKPNSRTTRRLLRPGRPVARHQYPSSPATRFPTTYIHTWRPSTQKGQVADISIRLTEHVRRGPEAGQASTERPLADGLVEKVEYDLGSSFRTFEKHNAEASFRLDISAYGPTMCMAKVCPGRLLA